MFYCYVLNLLSRYCVSIMIRSVPFVPTKMCLYECYNDIFSGQLYGWTTCTRFYTYYILAINIRRGNIFELTFEIYRSEYEFYYGHSYIARHDERIRFNGQTNDRCAADRELEIMAWLGRTHKVGSVSAKGKCETC